MQSFTENGITTITAVGSPFSETQSSCSNHKPKKFIWTETETANQVFMDSSIIEGLSIKRTKDVKRFAWVCESRAIIPNVRKLFDNEVFEQIIDSYDGIFTCEKELVDKHEKIHFCFAGSNLPWTKKENYKIYEKSKLVSFICSSKLMCEGHQFRHDLYEEFKIKPKFTNQIDVYGSITGNPFGYNPGCHLPYYKLDWHNKSAGLNDYMFSVVMENDQYDDYFTEKITDCFATGTVPIYWGTKNIGNYFNSDGIIQVSKDVEQINSIVNSLTPDMYYDKMDAIKDNFEKVKELKMSDDMLVEKIKELQ